MYSTKVTLMRKPQGSHRSSLDLGLTIFRPGVRVSSLIDSTLSKCRKVYLPLIHSFQCLSPLMFCGWRIKPRLRDWDHKSLPHLTLPVRIFFSWDLVLDENIKKFLRHVLLFLWQTRWTRIEVVTIMFVDVAQTSDTWVAVFSIPTTCDLSWGCRHYFYSWFFFFNSGVIHSVNSEIAM